MFRKKKVSDVSFIGKRSGDNECFCWDVSEEEYRKAVGEARYQRDLELESEMYKDIDERTKDDPRLRNVLKQIHKTPWRLYPNSVTGNLDDTKEYRFRIIVEEI